MKTKDRLSSYVKDVAQRYPDAWKILRNMRNDIKDAIGWPDWCYCPLAAAAAIADDLKYVSIIGALAPWRLTRGIYRFDADFFSALWDTEIEKIPLDVLYNLKEWCVYIECPIDIFYMGSKLYGWFYHLEYDANDGRTEMRFLLDCEDSLTPISVHVKETISEGIDSMLGEAKKQSNLSREALQEFGFELPINIDEYIDSHFDKDIIRSMVSVVLYLCSDEQDIVDVKQPENKPSRPLPKKTKRGNIIFPKDREVVWHVGYRIGGSVRNISNEPQGGKVRPHIRRAHWHSYWIGKKDSDNRKIILKWIPPMVVGADDEDVAIPFTVYSVEGEVSNE